MNSSSTSTQIGNIALAASFIVLAAALGYRYIGLAPVIIVGGSGLIGLFAWSTSYLKRPTSPEIILPCFLLTVAALEVHMMEEYLTGFAPAMSRLFNITWTERGFLIVFTFVGPALYSLTAIGLFYRIRFAGFLAWFIFIGPGVAEFTHFIFPLLRPAINPETPQRVSHQFANGVYISDLPNYYIHATGTYYFAGMYTAILPMIPGIYAIYRLLKEDRRERQSSSERMKNFSKAAKRVALLEPRDISKEDLMTGASERLTNREKLIYRTTTGIVCAVMVFSIINFIFNDHFPFPNGPEGAFVHLGLPHYFKIELTTAKILGVLALLVPSVPLKIKEFAYFGFGITLLSASIAHFARGDARLSVFFIIDPLFFLVLLIVSYVYFEKSHSFSARQSPEG